MLPLIKGPSDSSNVNTHAPRITWTLMFFFPSPLHYASRGLQMICLPCVLIAHWTAWLHQTQGHSSHVFCVVLLIASPFLSVSFFLFTRPLLTTNFSASSETSVFFNMLLKAVVRAQTLLHIQKASLTCHFWALHAGMVSLVTGLGFLHSGWPPWATGCQQIAVGWQISSSAPLICAVGPLA